MACFWTGEYWGYYLGADVALGVTTMWSGPVPIARKQVLLSGTGSRRVPVPAKGGNYCSSVFEIRLHGIGDLQSQIIHSKRVLRIWDPPLTPDGLQIRLNKGSIEVEKPGGDRHPLTGRASPQMTPKTPRPSPKRRITHELLAPRRGERLKPKTSRPLPKGREWGRGKRGKKQKIHCN